MKFVPYITLPDILDLSQLLVYDKTLFKVEDSACS